MTVPSNRIMRTPEDQEIIMRRITKLAEQFRIARNEDPELLEAIRVGGALAMDYIHESIALPKPHAPKPNTPWGRLPDE